MILEQIFLGKWRPRAEYGECGYDNTNFASLRNGRTGRAFGGKEIEKPGNHNYLALLAFSDLNENNTLFYDCTGSILNRWYILTSASCVLNSKKPLRYICN